MTIERVGAGVKSCSGSEGDCATRDIMLGMPEVEGAVELAEALTVILDDTSFTVVGVEVISWVVLRTTRLMVCDIGGEMRDSLVQGRKTEEKEANG